MKKERIKCWNPLTTFILCLCVVVSALSCKDDAMCKNGETNPNNECEWCQGGRWVYKYSGLNAYSGCCIDGKSYRNRETHPVKECLACDGLENRWSARPGGCCIDDKYYKYNEENPNNPCQTCIPGVRIKEWTNSYEGKPCPGGECDGEGNCVG